MNEALHHAGLVHGSSIHHPHRCPVCGQGINARDPRPLIDAALNDQGMERLLAKAILDLADFGAWVPTKAVIEKIYGDDPPSSAKKCVHVFAFRAREMLQPFGLTIRGRIGGHKGGGYRLEWLPQ